MKNYNKQDEVYCFIVLFCPLFNLFNSSTTDFSLQSLTGSGTLILCNVQLTMQFKLFNATTMYNSTEKCKKNQQIGFK